MRLFQNSGASPAYCGSLPHDHDRSFRTQVRRFLDDRYGAIHFLAPILNGDDGAFFTNGDNEKMQRAWAREMGMPEKASLAEILLAQIESHRTEVFYNLDPVLYGSDFVRRLPACVKRTIAWRAAPSGGADFGAYDLVVCNFPSILAAYRQQGWKAAYFFPAHDPAMDGYAKNDDRPIDVLFVGSYSRHHAKRAKLLEAIAGLRNRYCVDFRLSCSRFTRLAESPVGYLAPLKKHRRPSDVRAVSRFPVYGRDLYALLAQSKIVLNGAIDMAGKDRGNMRCFESMGCRSLLLSDDGLYPEGMTPGTTLVAYTSTSDALTTLESLLQNHDMRAQVADAGHAMITSRYSKQQQWIAFCALASDV